MSWPIRSKNHPWRPCFFTYQNKLKKHKVTTGLFGSGKGRNKNMQHNIFNTNTQKKHAKKGNNSQQMSEMKLHIVRTLKSFNQKFLSNQCLILKHINYVNLTNFCLIKEIQ